jgi:hypothetical protein
MPVAPLTNENTLRYCHQSSGGQNFISTSLLPPQLRRTVLTQETGNIILSSKADLKQVNTCTSSPVYPVLSKLIFSLASWNKIRTL